jgi:hypothetical protein
MSITYEIGLSAQNILAILITVEWASVITLKEEEDLHFDLDVFCIL